METGQGERAIVTVTRVGKEVQLHPRWLLGWCVHLQLCCARGSPSHAKTPRSVASPRGVLERSSLVEGDRARDEKNAIKGTQIAANLQDLQVRVITQRLVERPRGRLSDVGRGWCEGLLFPLERRSKWCGH